MYPMFLFYVQGLVFLYIFCNFVSRFVSNLQLLNSFLNDLLNFINSTTFYSICQIIELIYSHFLDLVTAVFEAINSKWFLNMVQSALDKFDLNLSNFINFLKFLVKFKLKIIGFRIKSIPFELLCLETFSR